MIYNQGNECPLPHLDLLTFLFDFNECKAKEDTPLHAEARDPTKVITKAHARELTEKFAHFLRHQYGIGKSGPGKDVVLAVSTGQSALACLFYGVIAAEGIYSSASPLATVTDLTRQVKDGPSKVIVCGEGLEHLALGAARNAGLPDRNVLILKSHPSVELCSIDGSVHCDFRGSLDWRRITDPKELEYSKICLLYSSGTTGLPKGVLLSHTNLVSECYTIAVINRTAWKRLGMISNQRSLGHLPTAHIAGLLGYFVTPFFDGGIVYWMPSFNFDDFTRYFAELKLTHVFTVPPIYMAIAKHPAVKDQFKHVQTAYSGAAPLSGELQKAASSKLMGHLTQVWGLGETTGAVTHTPPGRYDTVGSLSPLMPNITMRLVDHNDHDVELGQEGEALLKGPQITKGYHNNPEANKAAFTADGWFRTGDVLRMEGDLPYLVDRKKEMIKYKGLQVAPAELEGLLVSHSAVSDAAVIGTNREDTEVPTAYVVLTPGQKGNVSEADLENYVQSKVADYKRLRGGVIFIEIMPRSSAGKILRKDLRELHRKSQEIQSKL